MRACIPVLFATAVIALAGSPVAHADAHDDDFVNNLAGQGITGDPAKLVTTAHMVCTTSKEAGAAVPGGLGRMLPMGYVVTSLHLNIGQVNQFVDTARGTYCPDPAAVPAAAPDSAGAPPAGAPDAPAPPPPAAPAPAIPAMATMPGLPGIPGMDRLATALGGG
jgi:hypothetical protein